VTPSPPAPRLLNDFLHCDVISRSRAMPLYSCRRVCRRRQPTGAGAAGTGHISRLRLRAERNTPFTGFEAHAHLAQTWVGRIEIPQSDYHCTSGPVSSIGRTDSCGPQAWDPSTTKIACVRPTTYFAISWKKFLKL